jgi:hypothetical protein
MVDEEFRFEATLHGDVDPARVADLDVDRVPDPAGGTRVLLEVADCVRLLQAGYEVHLHRAMPKRPLERGLRGDDDNVRAWFEENVRSTGRQVP